MVINMGKVMFVKATDSIGNIVVRKSFVCCMYIYVVMCEVL